MDSLDLEKHTNLYKDLSSHPSSSYFPIIDEELPDMVDDYEFKKTETLLQQTAPSYKNHSLNPDLDISINSEDGHYSLPMQKPILFADVPCKSSNETTRSDFLKNLPSVYSGNDNLLGDFVNEDTYSTINELPSDELTYFVSDNSILTDGESNEYQIMFKSYPDSFDEIESPCDPIRNTENVYQYFQNCLEIGEKMQKSFESSKKVSTYEDVVNKVINNYHNLSSKKINLDPSNGWSNNSSTDSRSSAHSNSRWSSSCDSLLSSTVHLQKSSQSSSMQFSSPKYNTEDELSDSFCKKFSDLRLTEPLNEIILEPPEMFKTEEDSRISLENSDCIEFDINENLTKANMFGHQLSHSVETLESIFEQYDVHLTPNKRTIEKSTQYEVNSSSSLENNFSNHNEDQFGIHAYINGIEDSSPFDQEEKFEKIQTNSLFSFSDDIQSRRHSSENGKIVRHCDSETTNQYKNADSTEKSELLQNAAFLNTSTELESLPTDTNSLDTNLNRFIVKENQESEVTVEEAFLPEIKAEIRAVSGTDGDSEIIKVINRENDELLITSPCMLNTGNILFLNDGSLNLKNDRIRQTQSTVVSESNVEPTNNFDSNTILLENCGIENKKNDFQDEKLESDLLNNLLISHSETLLETVVKQEKNIALSSDISISGQSTNENKNSSILNCFNNESQNFENEEFLHEFDGLSRGAQHRDVEKAKKGEENLANNISMSCSNSLGNNICDEDITVFRSEDEMAENSNHDEKITSKSSKLKTDSLEAQNALEANLEKKVTFCDFNETKNPQNDFLQSEIHFSNVIQNDILSFFDYLENRNTSNRNLFTKMNNTDNNGGWIPWKPSQNDATSTFFISQVENSPQTNPLINSEISEGQRNTILPENGPPSESKIILESIIPVIFKAPKIKLFDLGEHVRHHYRNKELFKLTLRDFLFGYQDSNRSINIESVRFDDMPNSLLFPDGASNDCWRYYGQMERETATLTPTRRRWLTEVLVVNDDEEHATNETLVAADRRNSSLVNNLTECWTWKSFLLSESDTPSHLRIWRRTFPPLKAAETMRSLNSSKLDLTGCVTPELCVFDSRNCHSYDYVLETPVDESFSVVRDLIFNASNRSYEGEDTPDESNNLCISNIKAIREFSDYFKKSLETDSKLREGIPDLSLDSNLDECNLEDEATAQLHYEHDVKDQVTSFVFSSPSSSPSPIVLSDEDNTTSSSNMKNKKKLNTTEDSLTESEESAGRPSILKSALKRGSKKVHKKKHRVHFDESLNKFFEADYVILVRDEDYDDDYGRCECGNQFCYEGCYYEDEDEYEYEHPVDSPRYDFAAAFEPPMEFVDPVTLSPPDGYKDGCSGLKVSTATMTFADNEDYNEKGGRVENREKIANENVISASTTTAAFCEKPKNQDRIADDSYVPRNNIRVQGYPFHPNDVNASSQLAMFHDASTPTNGQSRYIVETITMTTVTERHIVHESNDQIKVTDMHPDKCNNGILKGGKLWRNSEDGKMCLVDNLIADATPSIGAKGEDDKRSVKFTPDNNFNDDSCDKNENYEKGEFTLTFKLGNRVVPCNSLKPNSAVRQLFPDPRFVNPPTVISEVDCDENLGKCEGKYLVTEESLRAFNEVNRRSVFATFKGKERYPYKDANFTIHSDDEDIPQNDLVKKTIERNTLRRSLMRYPKGQKRGKKKCEVSLEDRIKQLCVDDEVTGESSNQTDWIAKRTSPPGEESQDSVNKEKSSYKKFTEIFRKGENQKAVDQYYPYYQSIKTAQPDLGVDMTMQNNTDALVTAKKLSTTNEARKQFLSSLAPLTACVTGHVDSNYAARDALKLKLPEDRHSVVSTASTGTDYSLGDIDDALCKPQTTPQPDVIAGTPSIDSNQDELAMFVQQDAGRIERIKKRYNNTSSNVSDDDEHDDYGFSRRPSVRGIKPRFGSTTEILQQIQAQLQPPLLPCPTKPGSHMTWPYYSAEITDPKTGATSPRNPALPAVKEENSTEYTTKVVWEKAVLPPRMLQQPLKVDTTCNNVHMFRLTPSDSLNEVVMPSGMTTAHLPINNNIFQMKVSPVAASQVRLPNMQVPDGQFTAHPIPVGTTSVIRMGHGQQQTFRVPCPVSGPVQVHLLATHHYENPQVRSSQPLHFPSQIVVAKGTQTSSISTTSFYQLQTSTQSHFPSVANVDQSAICKNNTTSAEQPKLIQVNYTTAHPSPPIPSLNSSPTRVKPQNHLTERGIPEGAACLPPAYPQDSVKLQSQTTESTGNVQQSKSGSTMMYGMKV